MLNRYDIYKINNVHNNFITSFFYSSLSEQPILITANKGIAVSNDYRDNFKIAAQLQIIYQIICRIVRFTVLIALYRISVKRRMGTNKSSRKAKFREKKTNRKTFRDLERLKQCLNIYDTSLNSKHYSQVELSFHAGDVITVYGEMDEDGFYVGELNGVRGLVPSNFLHTSPPNSLLPSQMPPQQQPQQPIQSVPPITIPVPEQPKVKGVVFQENTKKVNICSLSTM